MKIKCILAWLFMAACSCIAAYSFSGAENKNVQAWVADLASNNAQRRDMATWALIAQGPSAIDAVSKIIGSPDAEVDLRGKVILSTLFDADDDETHRAVCVALRKLSKSNKPAVARFASDLLNGQQDLIVWIKRMGGEFTVDETASEPSIVELRLDRTRGTDPGFFPDQLRDADLKKLKILRHLHDLTLESRTRMSDEGLIHLAGLKSLETLNLRRTSIQGHGLADLAEIKTLKLLDLSHCGRLSDEGLGGLKNLKQLRELKLDGSCAAWCNDDSWMFKLQHQMNRPYDPLVDYRGGISDAGLVHVGELRGLTSLSLERTLITNPGLASLANLNDLEQLNLSRTRIDDGGLKQLAAHKKLKVLDLSFTPITASSIKLLNKLPNLEVLRVRGTNVTDGGLKAIVGLKKLHTLDVYGTPITDASIEFLCQLPNLKSLNIGRCSISLDGLLQLAEANQQIDLGAALLAAQIARLDRGGKITSLLLDRNTIRDEHLKHLTAFRDLQNLYLANSSVTDKGLVYLSQLTGLKSLHLDNTGITDDGLKHLSELTWLETLGITGTDVTFRGVVNLFTNVQGRSFRDALRISAFQADDNQYPVWRTSRTSPGTGDLERGMYLTTSSGGLVRLDLLNVGLTDADVSEIAKTPAIGALVLRDNPITDRAMEHLSNCKQLEFLWCEGSPITGSGLATIAGMSNLHTLWLIDADLENQDIKHLRSLAKLRVLNLSGAAITDAVVPHLKQFKNLEYLIVDHSALSADAIDQLKKARPDLTVYRSQKRVLAALRERKRQRNKIPTGFHRAMEMRPVSTDVPNLWLTGVFGDAHFEIAESINGEPPFAINPDHLAQLTTLQRVDLVAMTVSSEQLSAVGRLPKLKSVSLYRSKVDDDSLANLVGLELEELNLERSTVTDAGLTHIAKLTTVKSISLGGYGTRINDKGVANLSTLENLETLSLNRTNITGESFSKLASLRNLKTLALRETPVNDEGVHYIAKLNNLETLDLSLTKLTDQGLEHLSELKSLKSLILDRTSVSDQGLPSIEQMRSLRSVSLWGTSTTEEGVKKLHRLRPDLTLHSVHLTPQ